MTKKKLPTESQEQQRLVLKLRWFWPDLLFFAIPNGGKRGKGEARTMVLEGVEKGTPDIFIAEPRWRFHGLFIEMKRAEKSKSVVSAEQSDKMRRLIDSGYKCVVAYGAGDALKHIDDYLDLEWQESKNF